MQELVAFLYEALASDFGIVVETSDPERLRQKLYAVRKDNIDFEPLAFIISPTNPQAELWIVRKHAEGRTAEGDAEPPQGGL